MTAPGQRFNSYFTFLVLAATLLSLTGCQTYPDKKKLTKLRIHLQTHEDPTGHSKKVSIFPENRQWFNINPSPVVDQSQLVEATLVEQKEWEGFDIRLRFNRRGSLLLENTTATHLGRRLLIFVEFNDTKRWLAAPVIHSRIADGELSFVPDATRQEAKRIVEGLQKAIKARKKRDSWL